VKALLFALCFTACAAGHEPVSAPRGEPHGEALQFAYGTTQGGELSSASTRGRATAILFVTTYDLASQLMAERLDAALHTHKPRANGGAVVLEAPKYAVMADAFRTTLNLSFPVAMADSDTLGGGGPFGHVGRVPLLVVLDRDGREVFRKAGTVEPKDIEQALALGSRHGSARGR
jgi:hypothetical protein